MGSLFVAYATTFAWLAIVVCLAYLTQLARQPSMQEALRWRLVGWACLFWALLRGHGFGTWDLIYRTIGGASAAERMNEWVFFLLFSLGVLCLLVAWIAQYLHYGKIEDD